METPSASHCLSESSLPLDKERSGRHSTNQLKDEMGTRTSEVTKRPEKGWISRERSGE
jgi:hypothetical protein